MAQPILAPDSYPKLVFLDTNFEDSNRITHLGLSFTATDTVSDLKQKILVEHPICFPEFGEIQIHALKIERGGKFYHLPDSVYIKRTLGGDNLIGHLYVDASSSLEHGEMMQLDPSFDQGYASPHVAHVLPDSASRRLADSNGLSLPQVGQIPCANEEVRVTKRLYSGGSSRESSRDPMTEVKHISDNHCELASPVGNTQLNSETRDKCDLGREDLEGPDKEIQCMAGNSRNEILEGSTQNEPTAKENKKDAYNDMMEPQYSLGEKIGRKNAASPSLSVESAEGICSLQSTGKKKRKSSDSHIAVAADLSHGKESREESDQGIFENNKDSGEIEAVVIGKSASLKKRHDDHVKEVAERNMPGSLDVNTRDPNACDVGAETNVFGVEKMDTNGEAEKGATEQVPLLQKIKESRSSSENVDGMRKRKAKKRQTDVARSAVEVQEKDQDTGVKMPVVPSDTESNDLSKIKTDGISLVAAGGETEKRTEEDASSFQEVIKSQEGGENVDGAWITKKRQTDIARSSKESNKHQSHRPRFARKSSGESLGEVVKKIRSNKSLLSTSSAIFKDDGSDSSSFGDEAGVDSDARTRAPNNLSSSDEESDASLNVSDSFEGQEDCRSSQIRSLVPKDMKLDSILRKSSMYKKLKSQSQLEGSTSDFVSDSEVNMQDP